MPCPETEPVAHPPSMAIILVIDLPTWLVATAGVCVLALLVWQGQTQTARRDSVAAGEDEDDKWHVVGEMAPDNIGEAASHVGEGMPADVAEVAAVIGDGAPESVAEVAPVASPALLTSTTPAQYFFSPFGERVHTRRTCRGLRNATAIFVSHTHELSGRTRCNVCFRY